MVSIETDTFGYLVPEQERNGRLTLYGEFLGSDPSVAIVPVRVSPLYLETAVHAVRAGIFKGLVVDPAYYGTVGQLMDVLRRPADETGVVDFVYQDSNTGALVGDCIAVEAFRSLVNDVLMSTKDAMAIVMGNGWETRVAMKAMRGLLTFMTIVGASTEQTENLDAGCRVEYMGEGYDSSPFDLAVNFGDGYEKPAGQTTVNMVSGMDADICPVHFEAMRLAMSVTVGRGLPGYLDRQIYGEFLKKLKVHI